MANNNARIGIGALVLSGAALVGIFTREGYTDNAVIPTKGDVPTIGFGTTAGVKMGDTISPVKAAQRALADAQKYEGAVKQCITAPLHQAEYDLYIDLSYNVGPTNFCYKRVNGKVVGPSTLAARLNAGDYVGACGAILEYKYAAGYDCSTMVDGKPNTRCWGVWKRRLESHVACLAAQ